MINSLTKCKAKLERAVKDKQPDAVIQALTEELEGIEDNIRYYSQSITDCQEVIMQLEDNLHDSDELTMNLNACQGEEMKYLFERVLAVSYSDFIQDAFLSGLCYLIDFCFSWRSKRLRKRL